jgi:DNA-binding transcriptional LysR family regulator
MELYHLKTFVTVASEKNLTRASKQLCLSQPALSAHIKSLEEELGIVLFNRTPKGMILTDEGELLKRQAQIALGTIDAIELQAKTLTGHATKVFKLGIHIDARFLKISEFLSAMSIKNPCMEFQFHQGMSWNIIERIKSGEIDGGYTFGNAAEDQDINFLKLHESDVFIVGPSNWKDRLLPVDMPKILRLPWIWSPVECPFHAIASNMFQKANIKPFKVALADHQATHHALASAGVGLTLMVTNEAHYAEKKGLIIICGEPVARMALNFAYPKNKEDESALCSLIEGLLETWQVQG